MTKQLLFDDDRFDIMIEVEGGAATIPNRA